MENMKIENLSEVSASLESILRRLEALEREVAILKGEQNPQTQEFDADEAIDLSLDVVAMPVAEVVTEDIAEEVPAVEEAVDLLAEEDIPAAEDIPTFEDVPATLDIPAEEDIPVFEEIPAVEDNTGIDILPEPEDIPATEEPVEAIELEPSAVDIPEPEPEPESEEAFTDLFGGEFDAVVEKPRRGRKAATTVNDAAEEKGGKAVMDVLAEKSAWLHDIPGPEVKSLRSAIALGDQVLFIRRLFRDDSALYQDTIDRLNNMTTLKEAVEYLSSTFPEWNPEEENVYRFMMAVRRKIRK